MNEPTQERPKSFRSPRLSLFWAICGAIVALVLSRYVPLLPVFPVVAATLGAFSFGITWMSIRHRRNLGWISSGITVLVYGIVSLQVTPSGSIPYSVRLLLAAQFFAVWVATSSTLAVLIHPSAKGHINEDAA